MLADVGFGCDKGVRYLVGGPQASIQVLRLLEWPNMQLSATLSGWTTATVAEEFLSPPAAGTLPCGWATGVTHSFTRAFTRATAVSIMNTSSVFDAERYTTALQARPVTSELRVSCQATCVSVAGTLVAHPHSVRRKAAFYKKSFT